MAAAGVRNGEGSTSLYGLYRYVRSQRVWFSEVLAMNRVWILHCYLEFHMFFLRRSYFFIIIGTTINKDPKNFATNYKAGLKQVIEGSGRS